MRSSCVTVTLLGLGASPLCGCSCASDEAPIDAAVMDVAIDAPSDAWMDAPLVERDAGDDDAMVVMDAGADATEAGVDAGLDATDASADVGVDAFDPCADCVAAHDCEVAQCVDGACVRGASEDRSDCDLGDDAGDVAAWCVSGACVPAYCGDGIVYDDEACDDGNAADDDACDNTCAWNRYSVHVGDGYALTLQIGNALAVDGEGTVLVAWHERDVSDGPTAIRVRRYAASGVLLDEMPLVVNSSIQAEPVPRVVGLSGGGFAFVYRMNAELYTRVVSADGELGMARRIADSFPANAGALGALGDGFVVAWSLNGTLYAQRYGASGTTQGSRIIVNTSAGSMGSNAHILPTIASQGDDWVVVWQRNQTPASPVDRSIFGRRFVGGMPVDMSEQLYSSLGFVSVNPVVIARPEGWLIAYTQGTDDPSGEIYTRAVSHQGVLDEPVIESGVDTAAVTESLALLCAYGDDDYWVAWHLRTSQNNARSRLGSQRDGVTPVPELSQVNQQIESNGWIEGLSCVSTPHGVQVAWVSNDALITQLIPKPAGAP